MVNIPESDPPKKTDVPANLKEIIKANHKKRLEREREAARKQQLEEWKKEKEKQQKSYELIEKYIYKQYILPIINEFIENGYYSAEISNTFCVELNEEEMYYASGKFEKWFEPETNYLIQFLHSKGWDARFVSYRVIRVVFYDEKKEAAKAEAKARVETVIDRDIMDDQPLPRSFPWVGLIGLTIIMFMFFGWACG